jgi:hypothetical protein
VHDFDEQTANTAAELWADNGNIPEDKEQRSEQVF